MKPLPITSRRSAAQQTVARRVPTPAAQMVHQRLSQASRLYVHLLSDDDRQAWRDYAATQSVIDPKTRLARPCQGDKLFVGLTCRFLQVNPYGTDVPRLPPSFPFAGDRITLTAQAQTGGVLWTASGPTSDGCRVELCLQELASPARTPQPGRYRTQAFASFSASALTAATKALPGFYVPACRFVCMETGQATPLVVLPKIVLPDAAPHGATGGPPAPEFGGEDGAHPV